MIPQLEAIPVAFSLTFAVAGLAQQNSVTVGVLEWSQCPADSPVTVNVRPLFGRRGGEWIALTHPEASEAAERSQRVWVVAFDGRNLGFVLTVDTGFHSKYAENYTRDHVLPLVPGRSVPRRINAHGAFRGWHSCFHRPARPLVLVSLPNFRDPQRWRPFQPDTSGRQAFLGRFRAAVDTVLVCPHGDEKPSQVWRYGPSDLLFDKSYQDTLGHSLLALRLQQPANACEFTAGPEWSAHWFSVGRDTLYLASQLELVDAGDYDGDGRSEVLFWHSGYAEDGYTLFYDQFRKRVDYWWSYH
jgi:hypothetical protein